MWNWWPRRFRYVSSEERYQRQLQHDVVKRLFEKTN